MKTKTLFQFLFFAISFYGFGAGMMDSFVIYHGWKFVGVAEFPRVHEEMGNRIVPFLVVPTLLMTILTVMMFWKRPLNIPKSWIALAFFFELVSWISSVVIQIPIQFSLHFKDEAALHRLLVTDWIRIAAWFGYITMVSRMLITILKRHNEIKIA